MATTRDVEKVLAAFDKTRPQARGLTAHSAIETVWVGKRVHAGPHWAQPLVGRSEGGEWRPGVYLRETRVPSVIWGARAETKALALRAAQTNVRRWAQELQTAARMRDVDRVTRGIDR